MFGVGPFSTQIYGSNTGQRATVGSSLKALYAIRRGSSRELTLDYSLNIAAGTTVGLTYSITAGVIKGLVLDYGVGAVVGESILLDYGKGGITGSSITVDYVSGGVVGLDITLDNNILSKAESEIVLDYGIRQYSLHYPIILDWEILPNKGIIVKSNKITVKSESNKFIL